MGTERGVSSTVRVEGTGIMLVLARHQVTTCTHQRG